MGRWLQSKKSFTLVELLIALAVLSIIVGIGLVVVNPVDQLGKTRDTRRKQDLAQIRTALEKYYEDKNRYPAQAGAADFKIQSGHFGSAWEPYMAKVPQDPKVDKTYAYVTDSQGQTFQLYAYLERGQKDSEACLGGCGPGGAYYFALTSTNTQIAIIPITPTQAPTPTPTLPPLPPGAPTPTPTAPPGAGTGTYFFSHNDTPQFMRADLTPEIPRSGQSQSAVVTARDTTPGTPSPITTVTATVMTDSESRQYPLTLTSGTNTNGTWTGSWTITGTINTVFEIRFTAINQNGGSSTVQVILN